MLFESKVPELIRATIAETRNDILFEENLLRNKLKNFYENIQSTPEYLGNYGFLNDDKQWIIPPHTTNITKDIIDEVSLIYKRPPQRKIVMQKSKSQKTTEEDNYTLWWQQRYRIQYGLKVAERYKKLLHNILFRVIYKKENKVWDYFIETDFDPHFTEDDPIHPFAYSLRLRRNTRETNREKVKEKEIWIFWSDEEVFYHDNDGKIEQLPNLPDYKNPFGIMPFIEMYENIPIDEYKFLGAKDLVETNQSININLMNLNMMIHYQAFDQPYTSGVPESKAKEIKVGPNKIINLLDSEARMALLGFQPKIESVIKAIEFEMGFISHTYKINFDWKIQGTPASGFSLIVRNIRLMEARQDDIDECIMQEKQLYKVIAKMQSFYKSQNEIDAREPKLNPEDDISVNFTEIDFPVNVDEDLKRRDWNIKNNVETPIDYIKKRDPDLSDDEALIVYQNNKKLNGNLSRRDLFKTALTKGNKNE